MNLLEMSAEEYRATIKRLVAARDTYGDPNGAIQDQIDKLFWLNLRIHGATAA